MQTEAGGPHVISRSSLKVGSFIDLATSTSTRADFTVIATVGIDTAQNVYILNIVRGRWEWPDAYIHIVDELLAQKVRLVGVETNGFQKSSFQELIRDPVLKAIAFHPVLQDVDKVSRSLLVSARGSNHKLFYASGAHWAEYLITEFINFPVFAKDDVVDAVCGAVELLNSFSPAVGVARPATVRKRSNRLSRGE
ncbi:MAG: CHASE2 domain-containing protein [Methanothrix sp.]|nr:MAG: CHASE2 domain-containing protein [Methanothrix sp.]